MNFVAILFFLAGLIGFAGAALLPGNWSAHIIMSQLLMVIGALLRIGNLLSARPARDNGNG